MFPIIIIITITMLRIKDETEEMGEWERLYKIENIHNHNNKLNSYDFPMCEYREVVIRFTAKPILHIE